MTRNQYCPNCKKAVVGLFHNSRNEKKQFRPIRKAFYCKYCDSVLKNHEVVYKIINWEKKVEV
jgi:hypothetical protein